MGLDFILFWDIGLVYLDHIYLDKWEWFDKDISSWVEVDFIIHRDEIKPLY